MPVLLCMGTHEERKNFALAIHALWLLKQRGIKAELRIIGTETEHTSELQAAAESASVKDQVSFVGYATREEIVKQLMQATALIFVSRYEGYGMPPQEAQSLGCPVVLSDIGCHRAVYDDPLRWGRLPRERRQPPPFVDPDDPGALADELQRLIELPLWRRELARAGVAYQDTYSAQETAAALQSAFDAALKTPAGR
jgi:glycosyltransferase involved in cell wall biosynthesis